MEVGPPGASCWEGRLKGADRCDDLLEREGGLMERGPDVAPLMMVCVRARWCALAGCERGGERVVASAGLLLRRVPYCLSNRLFPLIACLHPLQVTGQNPQSSTKTAELVVEALQL